MMPVMVSANMGISSILDIAAAPKNREIDVEI
jgi:hypothetical protein